MLHLAVPANFTGLPATDWDAALVCERLFERVLREN